MSLNFTCEDFPLSKSAVQALWSAVLQPPAKSDEIINIHCVSVKEIQKINRQYRHINQPTSALTFNYGGENDIVICLPIIKTEAETHSYPLPDYAAHVLAHALLHAAGFDHIQLSDQRTMRKLERKILVKCGFKPVAW